MNGFINLLKPPGMSSGAAVAVIKRLTHEKVGHAGTLDPEAAGVLPIMVGRATRLLDYFSDKEKEYIAQIRFGFSTDTQDAEGNVLEKSDKLPSMEDVLKVLPQFTGTIMQCPPAYSAIKKDGVPLYLLARKGNLVQTEPRPTSIHEIQLLSKVSEDTYVIRVACGKGTYIRTLCHDIGQALGCFAHMRFLLRTQSGPFFLNQTCIFEDLMQENADISSYLMPLDAPIQQYPRLDVQIEDMKKAINGVALDKSKYAFEENQKVRVYLLDDFIGMATVQSDQIVFSMLLTSANEFCQKHGI